MSLKQLEPVVKRNIRTMWTKISLFLEHFQSDDVFSSMFGFKCKGEFGEGSRRWQEGAGGGDTPPRGMQTSGGRGAKKRTARRRAPPRAPHPAPYLRNGNPIKSIQSVPRETKSETVKGDSRRDNNARRVALCARAYPAPHPALAPYQPLLHVRPLQRAPCQLSFHFYITTPSTVT